jgi:hypothetical protein
VAIHSFEFATLARVKVSHHANAPAAARIGACGYDGTTSTATSFARRLARSMCDHLQLRLPRPRMMI